MKDDLPNDSEIPFIFAVCFKVLEEVFMLLSRIGSQAVLWSCTQWKLWLWKYHLSPGDPQLAELNQTLSRVWEHSTSTEHWTTRKSFCEWFNFLLWPSHISGGPDTQILHYPSHTIGKLLKGMRDKEDKFGGYWWGLDQGATFWDSHRL